MCNFESINGNCSKIYSEIYSEISKVPVIDTHEHLHWDEKDRVNENTDVLKEYLIHYLKSDLISAGLKTTDFHRVIDVNIDILERWNIVEPYWEVCRYTGYGRALDISVKGIYGIDGINQTTIRQLNEAFFKNKTIGHYQHVLKDLCGIKVSLLDVWTNSRLEGENPLFKRIWQPLTFILPNNEGGQNLVRYIEGNLSTNLRQLDDWLLACERELDYVLKTYGVKVLKCAIAYDRSLYFEKVSYSDAKNLFASYLDKWRSSGEKAMPEFPKELQDFMMHYVLNLANKRYLIIQFHTGILEGNGNTLANSNPLLLNNLFSEYPDVDFDLFHISYPFQNIASALSKMFPNVFIDMCWSHIISPTASVSALDEFLDAVPYNKISAFGGDYCFVDGVYGHLQLARENVSQVLARKVQQGIFPIEKAIDIGNALFYDNPKRIFKLDDC